MIKNRHNFKSMTTEAYEEGNVSASADWGEDDSSFKLQKKKKERKGKFCGRVQNS